jgi:hypothetical protein
MASCVPAIRVPVDLDGSCPDRGRKGDGVKFGCGEDYERNDQCFTTVPASEGGKHMGTIFLVVALGTKS